MLAYRKYTAKISSGGIIGRMSGAFLKMLDEDEKDLMLDSD